MFYIVKVPEVWHSYVRIEANSEEEALERVENSDGETIDDLFEFSHVLDTDQWEVKEG